MSVATDNLKVRSAAIGFGLLSGVYLFALLWFDSRGETVSEIPKMTSALPVLLGITVITWVIRYIRWYWLLNRAGNKTSFASGFLAYLSGFAFTATPGKVGELLRIRYLAPQGVPPWKVLAAFVYERASDLLAVLLLASFAIVRMDIFVFVSGFVVIFLGIIALLMAKPAWLRRMSAWLRMFRLVRLVRIINSLRNGLSGCRIWLTPLDVFVSLGLGVIAWGLTSFSFVYLLVHLGIALPMNQAIGIYPIAMLAGAASMLPGGVGSTEVTIVAFLTMFDVPINAAALAAMGIRLATLWFSVICGFIALSALEYLAKKKQSGSAGFQRHMH